MKEQEKMYIRAALYALFKLADRGCVEYACKVDGKWKRIEIVDAIEYFERLAAEEE